MEATTLKHYKEALKTGNREQAKVILGAYARHVADSHRLADEKSLRGQIEDLRELQAIGGRHLLMEEELPREQRDFVSETIGIAAGVRMTGVELAMTMLPARAAHVAKDHRLVLEWLNEHVSATTQDILRGLHLPKSTLSGQLSRLENHQLVERIRRGRTGYLVQLTPLGSASLETMAVGSIPGHFADGLRVSRLTGQGFANHHLEEPRQHFAPPAAPSPARGGRRTEAVGSQSSTAMK
jgi:DNA-binding transcriptional ArsR family regulator